MAQAVKCFPYKCGDPSLELQHPQKSACGSHMSSQDLGGRDGGLRSKLTSQTNQKGTF